MLPAQVVHPVGFQQGRRDIDIARLFGYQFPAQGDDLRQVKVVKDRFPVPDTLETGIQPTSHIDHNRTGMRFNKPPHGTVEIPSAHHASHFAQLCSIELGVIVFQTVRQPFRCLVIQDGIVPAAFFGSHV